MNKIYCKQITLILLTLLCASGCLERFTKPPQTTLSVKRVLNMSNKPLSAVISEDNLFLISLNRILALDKDLKRLWDKQIRSEILTVTKSPKYLLITTQNKQAILINKKNETITTFKLDSLVAIKPVFHKNKFYLFDYAGSIITINSLTKKLKVISKTKRKFSNQIGIFKNRLFIGAFDKHLLQLSTTTRKIVSLIKVKFKPDTRTLFHQSSYIVGGKNCLLYKFNLRTNKLIGTEIEEGWIQQPQIKSGKLYYTTVLNRLVMRNASNLKLIFDFQAPAKLAKPLILKDSIFITDGNGTISQISSKNGLLQGELRLKNKDLSSAILFGDNIYLTRGKELLLLRSKITTTDTRDLFQR